MPKFDLKKQIRDEFHTAVPPRAPKLDLEELLPQRMKQTTRPSFQRITALMALFVVVLLSALFTGWIPSTWTTTTTTSNTTETTSNTNTTSTTDTSTTTTTAPIILPVAETTIANPLITAANLSFSMGFSGATQLAFRLNEPFLMVDRHLDWIHRYVGALETMLSQTDGYPTEVLSSDREGYVHRLHAWAPTLSGVDLEFNLYYNIVNATDDNYDLVGLVVRDGVESPFEGNLKTEDDETKWVIKSYSPESPENNYVETKMKLEEETKQIQTRIFENGTIIHESLIKIEIEVDEAKIVVETTSQDESIVFDVKWEDEDGISKLKGSYQIEGLNSDEQGRFSIELFVDPQDQNSFYRYTITSGDTIKVVDKIRELAFQRRNPFANEL